MISGLEITFDKIREEVAQYLTGSRDMDQCEDQERREIEDVIVRGCRRFYYPATTDPSLNHEWTFLNVVHSFPTVSGTHAYDMPPDFGGFIGALTYAENEQFGWCPIPKISETQIRLYHSGSAVANGAPQYYCERPKHSDGMSAQIWQVDIWPIPDGRYILEGLYRVHPSALSGIRKYPYGGPEHANTIYLACMAEAELKDKGQSAGYMQQFVTALRGSVLIDRANHKPENMGYNWGKGGAMRPRFQRVRGNVTYGGI